jgi:hypothetical protein
VRLRERGATAWTTVCSTRAVLPPRLVDVRGALLDELDADLVRPVDEVDRHVADELGEIRALDGSVGTARRAIGPIGSIRTLVGHLAQAFFAGAAAGAAAARAVRRTIEASVPEGLAPTLIHFW